MAKAEKKKTLFDGLKPFTHLFNLAYGLNLGNRKPLGCVKRMRRKLQNLFVWYIFLLFVGLYFYGRLMRDSVYSCRFFFIIVLFCCFFFLFAFNEPEMERLIVRLKKYPRGKWSERATSKMISVFVVSQLLLLLPLLKYLLSMLHTIWLKHDSEPHPLVRAVVFAIPATGICLIFCAAEFMALSVLVFPILIALLCCVLVSYCPSRLDDHIEDIRRAHSPLRRARLLTHLCYAYYRLQPLASMTNRTMALTMSLIKVFTMFLWVICLNLLEGNKLEILFTFPISQYSITLLWYLIVAPSANQMRDKIFQATTEVLMVDDEWQLHDSISRSLLIKMRLNLLKHLVHIRMDEGPFTLLGVTVDPETLFTIFIEANDLRTTLW